MAKQSRITFSFSDPARFALIADTHVFEQGSKVISPHVLAILRRMNPTAIIHAGDIACQTALDQLHEIAPVIAVRGNNDLGVFSDALPDIAEITCGKTLIRIVHGHGGRSAKAVAAENAPGADCLIYGHSHIPDLSKVGDTLVLNPGSANDRRGWRDFGVGYLDINSGKLTPRLILFADPVDLDKIEIAPLSAC